VLTGYSGGAHATGWAAELAHRYAPKLNIVGAAEGGTPANLTTTGDYIDGTVFFGLALMSSEALDRGFPGAGIYSDLNAAGKAAYTAMSTDCVGHRLTTTRP
jgi:secretory lipase